MRFWDTSAIVPLVVPETSSGEANRLASEDTQIKVWWGSRVECQSALRTRARHGTLDPGALIRAAMSIDDFTSGADEVEPSDEIRDLACDLVDRHPLRAADALQLAAALVAQGESRTKLDFVCLDQRLRQAAEREGFAVLPA